VSLLTRRDFLAATLLAPALGRLQPVPGGRLAGIIPFGTPGAPVAPLGQLLGNSLDARQFSDLSSLAPDSLVTATNRFFVRTAAAPSLPGADGWRLAIGGEGQTTATLDMRALEALSRATGRYLVECAGNADPANFGLMSVADWEGVPLPAVVDRLSLPPSRGRLLVSGFDDESFRSRTSIPGASWIFPREDLQHALLALRMNAAPLAPHHGAPVRLIVPGWYGCACIKWVTRIEVVPDAAPPTPQMREFAGRTHQVGPPPLARDYTPAVIDTAAAPVRVEKWITEGRVFYRVVGIVWGGAKPTNALAIRFKASQPWTPVENCAVPASTLTWSLWTHTWRPEAPGRYEIALKVTDPSIRTRRLDVFYYVREVIIEET
jgi:DMSO/TMAO reductase YedYZ molybdopterin-dependent catalytic subunit